MSDQPVNFTKRTAERIADAVRKVEGASVSEPKRRPRIRRYAPSPSTGRGMKWVIVRMIPAQADPTQSTALWVWVERAVKAMGHDDPIQETYGVFTGRGPREPGSTPPSQGYGDDGDVERWLMGWEKMRIHPHTFARHYNIMRWPSDAPITRETDILKAEFVDGEWRVLLPFGRIWNDQLDPATAVGDCRPQVG